MKSCRPIQNNPLQFEPIGVISSCFKEKFGIPRQAGLASEGTAVIRLRSDRALRESVRGLEVFSHLWVVFVFHDSVREGWRPLVRPPRLGGVRKVGVLATRSPHRPNPIGISAVRIMSVESGAPGGPRIEVAGADFLDGTPVLDLKPYLPYADSIPRANAAWASQRPKRIRVSFSRQGKLDCLKFESRHPKLRALIRQILALDPRPAFQAKRRDRGTYSCRLLDLDVHWTVDREKAEVSSISPSF